MKDQSFDKPLPANDGWIHIDVQADFQIDNGKAFKPLIKFPTALAAPQRVGEFMDGKTQDDFWGVVKITKVTHGAVHNRSGNIVPGYKVDVKRV